MSSDNHASFAKIGFIVSLGVVAIVVTLIYLGGIRGRSDVLLVESYSDKPATGLSVGSPVTFRGVKMGEVREISFIGSRYNVVGTDNPRIYILMALNIRMIAHDSQPEEAERQIARLVRDRGLRASVMINGITGLSRMEININDGEEFRTVPPISWTPQHVCIPPKDSLIDSFSVVATKLMNQINKMDFALFWSNLNASVEHVSQCAETANVLMQSRQADIAGILDNLTATSESLRELSAELRQDPSALVRGIDRPELDETAR